MHRHLDLQLEWVDTLPRSLLERHPPLRVQHALPLARCTSQHTLHVIPAKKMRACSHRRGNQRVQRHEALARNRHRDVITVRQANLHGELGVVVEVLIDNRRVVVGGNLDVCQRRSSRARRMADVIPSDGIVDFDFTAAPDLEKRGVDPAVVNRTP